MTFADTTRKVIDTVILKQVFPPKNVLIKAYYWSRCEQEVAESKIRVAENQNKERIINCSYYVLPLKL
jgi:hypothetical protein